MLASIKHIQIDIDGSMDLVHKVNRLCAVLIVSM